MTIRNIDNGEHCTYGGVNEAVDAAAYSGEGRVTSISFVCNTAGGGFLYLYDAAAATDTARFYAVRSGNNADGIVITFPSPGIKFSTGLYVKASAANNTFVITYTRGAFPFELGHSR